MPLPSYPGLPSYPDLNGASVFITGGGSGIGAGLTEAFLRQGARVAFVQRSDATAFCDEMVGKTGNRPLFLQCDITDRTALVAAIEQAAEAHGPVSVLVNNAANDQRHTLEEITEDFLDWSLAINFKAYIYACQAVVPAMRAMGRGSIININVHQLHDGECGLSGLHVGQFGAERADAQPGARVWRRPYPCECAGPRLGDDAQTTGAMGHGPKGLAAHMGRQCLPDTLSPDDIAGGVLFLASDSSRAMTGQALVIDGGVVVTG